jgi:hypothetical protein
MVLDHLALIHYLIDRCSAPWTLTLLRDFLDSESKLLCSPYLDVEGSIGCRRLAGLGFIGVDWQSP